MPSRPGRTVPFIFAGLIACLLASLATASYAGPQSKRKTSYTVKVPGTQAWTDTGIDLLTGDQVVITAGGTITFAGAQPVGPAGLARGFRDLLMVLPVNDVGRGALIGRIGNTDTSEAFSVSARRELRVGRGGRLYLGVNELTFEQPEGAFEVTVQITPTALAAGATPVAGSQAVGQIAGIDGALFAQIPRRVSDKDGNAGDMVNFLILGSEERVRQVFQAAGWVTVDREKKDAVLHGLIASFSKEAYTQMPMSELYLFSRPQDYGYAHAEPISVVATRHHLRLWKAPFALNGQTVWVGAGTHDIGFERDQRNNGITHKIDPKVDDERSFIEQSLTGTGLVSQFTYFTPPNPVTVARTATGGTFSSDGRVLVLVLGSSGGDRTGAFAQVFCDVLAQENPDGGQWGACSEYLSGAAAGSGARLGPLSTNYRLLILPGIFNSCIGSVSAFEAGQKHLQQAHGLVTEYLSLPNQSSESNAKLIAEYLRSHAADPRKYIVVGYSKGAPDFQQAMADAPDLAKQVAAFVTVAGAVGGSPIADVMPAQAEKYLSALKLGSCEGNFSESFRSLSRIARQQFLQAHPDPVVPSYSLVALSNAANTSKMLFEAWKLLSAYDREEDSQLTKSDAIVPGGVYLGAALADHLAVALPFEDASDEQIRAELDHNHYPRAALLEALVRFVAQDLTAGK